MLEGLRKWVGSAAREPAPSIVLRERDCHTHVIPGVDDGSRSLEESLDMLRLLHEAGARTVVSTSHVFPGRFPNEPEGLRRGFEALCREVDGARIPVVLDLGAEHWLDDSLEARVGRRDVLAFGPERYVLFEALTSGQVPVGLFEVVHAMRDGGYTPLLAHVERYQWLRGEEGYEVLADLRSAGARFQVNRTVEGMNVVDGSSRGKLLALLLDHEWIDEVGSDLHRATQDGRPYAM